MEWNTTNDLCIEVTIKRSVEYGRLYRINPSEGMLGIESGIVGVTAILQIEDMENLLYGPTEDDYLVPVVRQIQADKQVYLQGLEGVERDKTLDWLESQPWIVYEYQHSGEGALALPLEDFVDHTMRY